MLSFCPRTWEEWSRHELGGELESEPMHTDIQKITLHHEQVSVPQPYSWDMEGAKVALSISCLLLFLLSFCH